MTVDERIKQVDEVLPRAAVLLSDRELAKQLCEHFELKLGMLIRRAERLQEAAQHLVILGQ